MASYDYLFRTILIGNIEVPNRIADRCVLSEITVRAGGYGGTPFSGGKGSFSGSLTGALVLTLVTRLLIMMRTTGPVKQIINGLILLALLAMYNRGPAIRQ